MDPNRERLSKYLSYLLRHNPASLGLTLDADGFVSIHRLVSAINGQREWSGVTMRDLEEIQQTSDKRRFEIVGERIRALYGHTLPARVRHDAVVPPQVLFHGTARMNIQPILKRGLLQMRRQYVHLSATRDEAMSVGRRRDQSPVVIRVYALKAHRYGIRFFKAGAVFLSESIPAKFLELEAAVGE